MSTELRRWRGRFRRAGETKAGGETRAPPTGQQWCEPAAGAFPFPAPGSLRPGVLLAGGPAARPPPVAAAMAGPWTAAVCVPRILELLLGVSPGRRSRGPGGAERPWRGSPSLARPPGLCSAAACRAGKGPGDPEGKVEAPEWWYHSRLPSQFA